MNLFVYLGGALSVPVVAAIYDKTGSYQVAWLLCIALMLVSMIALLYSDLKCQSFTTKRIDLQQTNKKATA